MVELPVLLNLIIIFAVQKLCFIIINLIESNQNHHDKFLLLLKVSFFSSINSNIVNNKNIVTSDSLVAAFR